MQMHGAVGVQMHGDLALLDSSEQLRVVGVRPPAVGMHLHLSTVFISQRDPRATAHRGHRRNRSPRENRCDKATRGR